MIKKEIAPNTGVENNKSSTVDVYLEDFTYRENLSEGEKRAMHYVEYLAETIEDDANYLDHGGAARVYTLGKEGGCVKVMKNRHKNPSQFKYDLGVSPLQEFKIMERVHGLEKSGCRAPIAEMCLESGDTSVIIMEQLPAVGLQHVLNGTQELPEGFDYDEFVKSLEEYIDALHSEKGVAHNDLYPRNVMIDEETGLPYVIDFGRSTILDGLSDDEIHAKTKDDWVKYDNIFAELEKLRLLEKPKMETIPLGKEEYRFGGDIHVHYSNHVLQQVFEMLRNEHPGNDSDLVITFGKNQNLLVSKNKDNVRGAFTIEHEGVVYYLGRKKKNYDVVGA
jgi:tRNA A-37 threonylcarbamoyl transferase component Bud32